MIFEVAVVAVVFAAIVLAVASAIQKKKGSVFFREKNGTFVIRRTSVDRLISGVAIGIGIILCAFAAFEKKTGNMLYGLTLGGSFFCAGVYSLLRALLWRVEISETGVYCRGPLGKRRFSWNEVRQAKISYGAGKPVGEALLFLEYGRGKRVKFFVPEENAEKVVGVIKKYPKIKFSSEGSRKYVVF